MMLLRSNISPYGSGVRHGGVLRKRGDFLGFWRERYFEVIDARRDESGDAQNARLVYYKEWRVSQVCDYAHPDNT